MTKSRLEEMSKEDLLRELRKLQSVERRIAAQADEDDRERLIHDLNVHQVELEMQNRELRETQERLEETSSRYSDLYDFAPIGYCTLDPKGCIQEINLTGAALLGVPRLALLGKPFSSVAPLEDAKDFYTHLQQCAREDRRVTSEIAFLVGRRTRTVQLVSDPVRRDHGGAPRAYRTMLVDVSELKSLEDRLRLLSDAGERLASSLDYATGLDTAAHLAVPALADLCMIDVLSEGDAVERKVVLFADAGKQTALAERMRQYPARLGWQTPQAQVIQSGEPMLLSDVLAEHRERLAHEELDADILRAAGIRSLMVVPLCVRARTFGAMTLAFAESDRRYSSVDFQVALDLSRRVAVTMDNARLFREQSSLRQRFEVLDRVSLVLSQRLSRSGVAVDEFLQDIVDQARLACDAQYAALGIGEDPTRPFDRWVFSGVPPTMADATARSPLGLLGEVIQSGHSIRLGDVREHPAFHGLLRHHPEMKSVLGVAIRDGGRPVGLLYLTNPRGSEEFTQDDQDTIEMLAQRAGTALEIVRLSNELRAAVSARDNLLAIVSHDLRNPLSAIHFSVQVIAAEGRAEDRRKSRHDVDVIARSTQRMRRLIDDLLQAATIEAGTFTVEPRREDAGALIEQVLAAMQPVAAGRSVHFERELQTLPPAWCDRLRIIQVLANLIENAIKHVPDGGNIQVRANAQADEARFAVSDNGPGIAADHIPYLFDRHWKGKAEAHQGFGLGLYIAKGIVEAHGGRIWVESQRGSGTTFYFTVPLARAVELKAPPH